MNYCFSRILPNSSLFIEVICVTHVYLSIQKLSLQVFLSIEKIGPGYDVKLHPITKVQFSTIEVLVPMLMTQWDFRIFPCLAGGNASATCLKMLVMHFADVQ